MIAPLSKVVFMLADYIASFFCPITERSKISVTSSV
ncbi:hypothetical protein BCSJ1_05476 [Bacillus cereus SJ1]|nr:hypothetical protein BCSJ1_05476 [Bacillus cereus SJ1]